MRNLSENYKAIQLKSVGAAIVASGNGSGIDIEQYNDDALALLQVGAAADAGATLVVTLKGSEDGGGTYPNLLATFATVLDTEDNTLSAIGFNVEKQTHVRAEWVVAGGVSPSFSFGVAVLLDSSVDQSGQNTGAQVA